MAADTVFTFTVYDEGDESGTRPPWRFRLRPGGHPVKIGRLMGCGIHLDYITKGISNVHAEVSLLESGVHGKDTPRLTIKDLSTNGCGLRRSDTSEVLKVPEGAQDPVPHNALLKLPFRVKAKDTGDGQKVAWLRIVYDDRAEHDQSDRRGSATGSTEAPVGNSIQASIQQEMMARVMAFAKQKEKDSATERPPLATAKASSRRSSLRPRSRSPRRGSPPPGDFGGQSRAPTRRSPASPDQSPPRAPARDATMRAKPKSKTMAPPRAQPPPRRDSRSPTRSPPRRKSDSHRDSGRDDAPWNAGGWRGAGGSAAGGGGGGGGNWNRPDYRAGDWKPWGGQARPSY